MGRTGWRSKLGTQGKGGSARAWVRTIPAVPAVPAVLSRPRRPRGGSTGAGSAVSAVPRMEHVYWLVRNRWEFLDDSQAILAAMHSPTPVNVVRVRRTMWRLDLDGMNLQRVISNLDGDRTDDRRNIMIVSTPGWDRLQPDTSQVAYYLRVSPVLFRLGPDDTMALDTARASGHLFVRLRLRSPSMLCVITFSEASQQVLHLGADAPMTVALIMVRFDRLPRAPRPGP